LRNAFSACRDSNNPFEKMTVQSGTFSGKYRTLHRHRVLDRSRMGVQIPWEANAGLQGVLDNLNDQAKV
jgi:hypothetical protein